MNPKKSTRVSDMTLRCSAQTIKHRERTLSTTRRKISRRQNESPYADDDEKRACRPRREIRYIDDAEKKYVDNESMLVTIKRKYATDDEELS